ncbi:hypothetical protein D6851_00585 [Altericroceibacterium spongiae]|uniref:Uncharacterized protein n=1 Tax=Altericroceibacterium spongiae TaxID=2320269 RepID=A0A420EQU2_9SPHN|nr:hypothetical protein [Altericroceibacterium spongiae]RKF23042.1 hypothetical protein D6851_00585 [Altericroceibacterium spongiae]
MPNDLMIAATCLIGVLIVAGTLLKGWQDWLALKSRELDRHRPETGPDIKSGNGAARIEIADLKERIRKLEAIASGVDL